MHRKPRPLQIRDVTFTPEEVVRIREAAYLAVDLALETRVRHRRVLLRQMNRLEYAKLMELIEPIFLWTANERKVTLTQLKRLKVALRRDRPRSTSGTSR